MSFGAESKDAHTSSALRCLREFSERTWHGRQAIIERLQRQCKLCRGASTHRSASQDLPRKRSGSSRSGWVCFHAEGHNCGGRSARDSAAGLDAGSYILVAVTDALDGFREVLALPLQTRIG